MADSSETKQFDSSRAEIFEVLGHPVRIKILESLKDGPLGFAELKRGAGLESSGNLQFHLGKLSDMVSATPDGNYALTDEGREALRVVASVSATKPTSENRTRLTGRVSVSRSILALLIAALILSSSAAVYQQFFYSPTYAKTFGTVTLNGREFNYLRIPGDAITPDMIMNFEGVTFHFLPSGTGEMFNRTCTEVPYLNTTRTECTTQEYLLAVVVDFSTNPPHLEGLDTYWPFTIHDPRAPFGTWHGNLTSTLGLGTPWFTNFTVPQAGVLMDTHNGIVTIYVSV
jgi:DNA-binding HxlR family transcriptional regulator